MPQYGFAHHRNTFLPSNMVGTGGKEAREKASRPGRGRKPEPDKRGASSFGPIRRKVVPCQKKTSVCPDFPALKALSDSRRHILTQIIIEPALGADNDFAPD